MSIPNHYVIVRGHKNGKIEIDNEELETDTFVRGMSVFVGATEAEAVGYLRTQRPGSGYGVTTYGKISRLNNFTIREDFAKGKNPGHYLIDCIKKTEAVQAFSKIGKL